MKNVKKVLKKRKRDMSITRFQEWATDSMFTNNNKLKSRQAAKTACLHQ